MMKIKEVTEGAITFSNGSTITFGHCQICCEENFADFGQIEEMALNYEFDENLSFESVEDAGFRFGDKGMMFFIPCYSSQNGWYSCDIQIYYNGKEVLSFNAKEV